MKFKINVENVPEEIEAKDLRDAIKEVIKLIDIQNEEDLERSEK